jgi:hypothetical protein
MRAPPAVPDDQVGTGYTRSELNEVLVRLKPHWRVFNKELPPCGMSSK